NVGDRPVHSKKQKLAYPANASVNPSTMLIHLCNMQPHDNPAEFAGVVHRLRQASEHTDIATLLPQPLHDVEAVRKYIPRYRDENADDYDNLEDG
ncbi:MAG: RNaseH domain-containing protein, partial [Chloroflexota bacterium]